MALPARAHPLSLVECGGTPVGSQLWWIWVQSGGCVQVMGLCWQMTRSVLGGTFGGLVGLRWSLVLQLLASVLGSGDSGVCAGMFVRGRSGGTCAGC